MTDTNSACVGIASCLRWFNAGRYHIVYERYVMAFQGGRLMPLIIPAVGAVQPDPSWVKAVISRLDGLFLPGSPSNVHPNRYGKQPLPDKAFDQDRDATTIPLIREAVRSGMPILAVCRGFQELNVALGGTLHADLEQAGFRSHRARRPLDDDRRYDLAHAVTLSPEGMLAQISAGMGLAGTEVIVNSLHVEGIDQLADELVVEARSTDGVIEAASIRRAESFVLGVQWHAEWRKAEPAIDAAIFAAFEAACLRYAARPGCNRNGR